MTSPPASLEKPALGAKSDGPRFGVATRGVVVASVVTVIVTVFLIAGITVGAVQRVDGLAASAQERLLRNSIRASIEKVPYDQQSVAIWDDAITNVKTHFNSEWVDSNLGSWITNYFHHDQVVLLNDHDAAIYYHGKDGKSDVAKFTKPPELDRLAAQLRQRIKAGALDKFEAGEAKIPFIADRIDWLGRPAIVSVMPIVSDTNKITQDRGTEFFLVSVRYLDESFVTHQAQANDLDGVRFSAEDKPVANERSFPIKNEAGRTAGYLIWTPNHPGGDFLTSMLPALTVGMLAFIGLIVALIYNVLTSYMRIKASEKLALHASRHDPLTGLPNRAYFEERLAEALKSNGGSGIALFFLDLDRFKQVNDTLGHPAGDQLIQTFARRLAKHMGPEEFLARLGGDEFAIIVPRGTNLPRVEALTEAVLTAAGTPFWLSAKQAMVGSSIGIAISKPDDIPSDLTRKADIALYQAKNAGRHRCAYFSEDTNAELAGRRQLEVDLRAAIKSGQGLNVVFQPIYDAATRTVSGAEALARWDNPRVGPIAPPLFVDIAEDCGLIEPLGKFILREACAVAAETGLKSISVNAAAAQFLNPDFAETVFAVLEETGLPPERLELELTERTLLDASQSAKASMNELRRRGVRISLDDFGTGYSSLSYLMQHKVDRLKIDRSFITIIEAGGPAASVVLAIITMAHALEIKVTAEGVETVAQMELLKLLSCDSLQGYYLSRPLPASQLKSLLGLASAVA